MWKTKQEMPVRLLRPREWVAVPREASRGRRVAEALFLAQGIRGLTGLMDFRF